MRNYNLQKRLFILFGRGFSAGLISLIVLWVLASLPVLQPFLLLPLGSVHNVSWVVVGFKIIPDGTWSTLFVSGYFFAVGPLVAALIYLWRRQACSSSAM